MLINSLIYLYSIHSSSFLIQSSKSLHGHRFKVDLQHTKLPKRQIILCRLANRSYQIKQQTHIYESIILIKEALPLPLSTGIDGLCVYMQIHRSLSITADRSRGLPGESGEFLNNLY